MFGVAANDLDEATYLVAFDDADGAKLSTGRYEIRFGPGRQPPVDAFWSLTAYTEDGNLIGNPIGRHSIGDRTPGLVTDPDGAVTLSLQPDSPGPDREATSRAGKPSTRSGSVLRSSFCPDRTRAHRTSVWLCAGSTPYSRRHTPSDVRRAGRRLRLPT